MSLDVIQNPFEVILGLDGKGLNAGKVYIGVENEDPETDPVPVFWDADGTIPATQPLDTIGGYIWRSGTPARAYVDGAYSVRVRDRFDNQVWYAPSVQPPSAATLNFIQAGAGAVERTAQSKLRDTVNVRDFGAVGDAVTDDTAAIQAAIDSFGSIGGFLMFPPGTFIISNSLLMRPGLTLFASPGTATIRQADGANLTVLLDFVVNAAHGAAVDGLVIDGNWENNSRSITTERFALYVATANDVVVQNSTIGSYPGHGIFVNDGLRTIVQDNYLHDLSRYGVYVSRTSAGVRNAPIVRRNRMGGVAWHQIVVAKSTGARIEDNNIVAIGNAGQVVTVSGSTVTWVSGPNFTNVEPGHFIIYNGGVEALIAAKVSNTELTLSTSPGDAVSVAAATGAGDLISSTSSNTTLISRNKMLGGASLGISIFADATAGNDTGAVVQGNHIDTIGSAGISIQTSGGGTARDTMIQGNLVIEAGLNGSAGNTSFNSGCTVSGTLENILIENNSWTSYGSAMFGLNIQTAGGKVFTSGNRYAVSAGGITNGATVQLTSGWGSGAAVSNLAVNDDVVSFTITTSAAPSLNPVTTIVHQNLPARGKLQSFHMVDSSTGTVYFVNTVPGPGATSVGTVLGTPASGATYRVVCRM